MLNELDEMLINCLKIHTSSSVIANAEEAEDNPNDQRDYPEREI